MAEEAVATADAQEAEGRTPRKFLAFLRRNVTPRVGAALALWRLEARLATPLALALVALWGRWDAALAMGAIMAVYSALFLFLLDGEQATEEMRTWVHSRRFSRRYLLPIAERRGRAATLQRVLAVPATVLLMGPFWRAVTYHLFRVPRAPAYTLSVGGSFPHSLLWTGLVLGGLWEGVLRPLLQRIGI